MNALVTVTDGQAITTSAAIAEGTKRQHKNVIELTRTYLADLEEFGRVAFETRPFATKGGEQVAEVAVFNEQHATLLLTYMRNSDIVRAFKKRLVRAFYDMARRLREHQYDSLRVETRKDGKFARIGLTDAVAEFVDYATAQGSKSAKMYFTNITLMEYRALFLVGRAAGENFRDRLTALQNMNLATAEHIAQRALREGMSRGLPYKEIYQLAKERVEAMAGFLGKSEPGLDTQRLETAA